MGCIQNIRSKKSKENIEDLVVSRENSTIYGNSCLRFLMGGLQSRFLPPQGNCQFLLWFLCCREKKKLRNGLTRNSAITDCHLSCNRFERGCKCEFASFASNDSSPQHLRESIWIPLGPRVLGGGWGGQITRAWWGGRKGGDNRDRESWRSQIGKCSESSFVYHSKLFSATPFPFDLDSP